MTLALWNHFGKKKKSACLSPFTYFFLFVSVSFQVFDFYPVWKNRPDCIKPDATGIVLHEI